MDRDRANAHQNDVYEVTGHERTGIWGIATKDMGIHMIDWDRQEYSPPNGPPSAMTERQWLTIASPIEFVEVGFPFRVFLDEELPREFEPVRYIDYDINRKRMRPENAKVQTKPSATNRPSTEAPSDDNLAEPLWTIEQLTRYLQISVKSVYNWRTKREGPVAVRVGGHLRWKRREVERWLAERTEVVPGTRPPPPPPTKRQKRKD